MIFKNPSCLPVSIHEQVYFLQTHTSIVRLRKEAGDVKDVNQPFELEEQPRDQSVRNATRRCYLTLIRRDWRPSYWAVILLDSPEEMISLERPALYVVSTLLRLNLIHFDSWYSWITSSVTTCKAQMSSQRCKAHWKSWGHQPQGIAGPQRGELGEINSSVQCLSSCGPMSLWATSPWCMEMSTSNFPVDSLTARGRRTFCGGYEETRQEIQGFEGNVRFDFLFLSALCKDHWAIALPAWCGLGPEALAALPHFQWGLILYGKSHTKVIQEWDRNWNILLTVPRKSLQRLCFCSVCNIVWVVRPELMIAAAFQAFLVLNPLSIDWAWKLYNPCAEGQNHCTKRPSSQPDSPISQYPIISPKHALVACCSSPAHAEASQKVLEFAYKIELLDVWNCVDLSENPGASWTKHPASALRWTASRRLQTSTFLSHFDIFQLRQLYNFPTLSSVAKLPKLLKHRLRSVALVSDAGTPLISDPGFAVLRTVHSEGPRFESKMPSKKSPKPFHECRP